MNVEAQAATLLGVLTEATERLKSLNGTMSTIMQLEQSSQVYSLKTKGRDETGGLSLNTENKYINISFGVENTSNFIHEVTHAGQFENRELAFDSRSGDVLCQDVFDEVNAYKAQYAYDPSSVSSLNSTSVANSFNTISDTWVKGLLGGNYYVPGGKANTGLVPLNIYSTKNDIVKAFPGIGNIPFDYTYKDSFKNIYYKK